MRPLALPHYAAFLAVAAVAIHIEPLLIRLRELARLLVDQYLVSIRVLAACLRLRHSPRLSYIGVVALPRFRLTRFRLSYIVVPNACFTTPREAHKHSHEQHSYRQQRQAALLFLGGWCMRALRSTVTCGWPANANSSRIRRDSSTESEVS